jgi:capsular exopolysaccharide synthesis family protein
MSRIQQILAKAERDGTARRIGSQDDMAVAEPPPAARPVTGRSDTFGAPVAFTERTPDSQTPPPPRDVSQRDEAPSVGDVPVESRVSVDTVLDPMLIAALDPLSLAAEQYRSLRSRISRAESGQAIRVLQVTSPGTNDGKTVTSLNLALTMAQEFQQRVLVIDADLRRPRVHTLLGLAPGPGLVDVLTGAATLGEALVAIPEYNLTVLPAGRRYDRPAELLGSAPMRRLIDALRSQFDRIVVDSPPAIVSDPGAVAPLVDRLLLVVRAGSTTRPAIARALSVLGSPKLLGLVFNDSGASQRGPYRASA